MSRRLDFVLFCPRPSSFAAWFDRAMRSIVRQDLEVRVVHVKRHVRVCALLGGIVFSGCSDGQSTSRTEGMSLDSTADVVSSVSSSVPTTTSQASLFTFTSPDSATDWSVVNDTVMGGVSSGQLVVDNGALVFSGELSLDNNGGFASVRSPAIEPRVAAEWSGRSGPQIVVEGDGRTWTVEVRTDDVAGGWIASLPTSPDSITTATVPWTSFEPVTRFLDPREVDEPLDVRRIVSVAFYLVDGIEAPFRLGLVSIS
jgi:NADH dehydrogenase [ubiquinone] 1 alpha subcomplex assembly factor 1